MPHPLLTQDMIDTYQRDGVIVIRGLFKEHVETLRKGVARNMEEPGPFASENKKEGETGRFFDDYCNWQRIEEFAEVIEKSPAAEVAADLMGSQSTQVFHDHILVKEPGTSMKRLPEEPKAPGGRFCISRVKPTSIGSRPRSVTGGATRSSLFAVKWQPPMPPPISVLPAPGLPR